MVGEVFTVYRLWSSTFQDRNPWLMMCCLYLSCFSGQSENPVLLRICRDRIRMKQLSINCGVGPNVWCRNFWPNSIWDWQHMPLRFQICIVSISHMVPSIRKKKTFNGNQYGIFVFFSPNSNEKYAQWRYI